MNLLELLRQTPSLRLVRPVDSSVASAVDVTGIGDDSRLVQNGWIFVARDGTKTDGGRFIASAVEGGAVAVLAKPSAELPSGPVALRTETPAQAGAQLAEALCGHPSRRLRLAAVTGTNGKTTVASLIQQTCNAAGIRCGLSGTVLVDDGDEQRPARLTTPTAFELSPLLRRMVDNGCGAAAIEASSHALIQGRLAGVRPSVAIFTNLSGDHLDYHGSMESYADAKAILFSMLDPTATAIVNADDPHCDRMVRDCRAAIVRCSLRADSGTGPTNADRDGGAWAFGEILEAGATATRLRLTLSAATLRRLAESDGSGAEANSTQGHEVTMTLPLVGAHNAMNALQALVAAIALGAKRAAAIAALISARAPRGRLEPVTDADAPFAVFVDYAHTDDALDSVLRAVRPVVPDGGRLIVVFGCGGDRDRTKRPRMAAAACRYADLVIVTSDNPRTEEPESIIDEIMTGVPREGAPPVRRDADRAAAIALAIDSARAGDVVLIAGKGHEVDQIIGSERRSFDDRLVAAAALAERASASR